MRSLLEDDLAGRHLIEHRLDEGRLDVDALFACGREFVVLVDWTSDRLFRRVPVEVLEAQVSPEQSRDLTFEAIELRERVFSDRDQKPGAQTSAVENKRQLVGECPFTVLERVVEEVLLELVEDDEDVGVGLRRPALQRHVQSTRRLPCGLAEHGRDGTTNLFEESWEGIVAPGGEVDGYELRRTDLVHVLANLLLESVHHASPQEGALPHAAVPVQKGQSSGLEVCDHNLDLIVAAEEEGGVPLFIRIQSLEGRSRPSGRRNRRGSHARTRVSVSSAVRHPLKPSRYSARGMSKIWTSRRCQDFLSSGSA